MCGVEGLHVPGLVDSSSGDTAAWPTHGVLHRGPEFPA
jgi:hypothetical protein